HLLVLGHACREMMERPLDSGEALRGIEDALLLSAEAASQLTDDRRSQTVTRTNLDEAIRALATSLAEPQASPAEWAARLRHLGTLADTLVDVARTFAAERGDGDDAAVLVWTRATHAAIQSHLRDVDANVPSSAAGRALGRRLSDIRRRRACWTRPRAWWSAARGRTALHTASPGESPNPPTTCAISSSPTSIRTSACPASASREGSARTS